MVSIGSRWALSARLAVLVPRGYTSDLLKQGTIYNLAQALASDFE